MVNIHGAPLHSKHLFLKTTENSAFLYTVLTDLNEMFSGALRHHFRTSAA